MSYRNAFPDCCGLDIISSFHIEKDFTDIPHASEGEDAWVGDYEKHGDLASVLVLNGRQKKAGHKVLIRKGYKQVGSFFNPKHSSVLYLYLRDRYPTMNPNSKKFNKKSYTKRVGQDGYEDVLLDGRPAVPDDWDFGDD